jgi:hypothetical protein
MNSGIYYRIERDGKWQTVDLTEMTEKEISVMIANNGDGYAAKLILALCKIMHEIEIEGA